MIVDRIAELTDMPRRGMGASGEKMETTQLMLLTPPLYTIYTVELVMTLSMAPRNTLKESMEVLVMTPSYLSRDS